MNNINIKKLVAKNSLYSLLGPLSNIVAWLFLFKFIISNYGYEQFGLWSLTIGVASVVRLFDLSGATNLSAYIRVANVKKKKAILNSSILISITCNSFFIFIFFNFIHIALKNVVSEDLQDLLLIFLIFSVLINIISGMNNALNSYLDGEYMSNVRSWVQVISLVLFILIIIFSPSSLGIVSIAVATITQQLFIFCVISIYIRSNFFLSGIMYYKKNVNTLNSIFKLGLKTFSSQASILATEIIPKYFISNYLGLSIIPIYELASKIFININLLFVSFCNPLLPRLRETFVLNGANHTNLLRQYYYQFTFLNILCYAFLIIMVDAISILFLGIASSEFSIIFKLLALCYFVEINSYYFVLANVATNYFRINIFYQFLKIALLIIIIILFIKFNTSLLVYAVGLSGLLSSIFLVNLSQIKFRYLKNSTHFVNTFCVGIIVFLIFFNLS